MKICWIALCAGLLVCSSLARAELSDVIFDTFPEKGVCTLRNGEKVPYPFHVYDARQISLVGAVDLEKLGNLLPKNGLYKPVVFGVEGLSKKYGIVLVQAIDYMRTNTIPYHEVVFTMLVHKPRANLVEAVHNFREISKDSRTFRDMGILYMFKLFLNEMLPTRAGRELGGFNKQFAKVDYEFKSDRQEIRVESARGGLIFAMQSHFNLDSVQAFPLVADFKAVTTAGYEGRSVMVGHTAITRFKNDTDKLFLNPKNPWMARLRELNFQPFLWQYDPQFKMVVTESEGMVVPSVCRPY